MRHRRHSRAVAAIAVTLALIVAACATDGGDDTTTTTTTTAAPDTTTTAPAATTTLLRSTTTVPPTTTTTGPESQGAVVYFLLAELEPAAPGPYLVPVFREIPVAEDSALAVVDVLLDGPTSDEEQGTPAISTAIPDGTGVLSVEIAAPVATVDLSAEYDDGGGTASMFARLAQVVFTLTRLPDVETVVFEIHGEPVDVFSSEGIELDGPQARDDYYDFLPPIFVDTPAWGEPVTSPVSVTGLSNVFEAVSQVMLTDDDGMPLFEETVMASCGTGCWGEWSTEASYAIDRDQFGSLIVWEFSAEDGSRINIREYPVLLR